ncbi:MAG: glycosyltransferase [Verrucomicrobiota bacterium]|nr:glycosyltransferase [Verrucomicrobiota bacterium]
MTSSTGGGHDARAVAFRRWVRKIYGWEVEVRVESMLEDSSRIGRFGVAFYNFIQKCAPWLHHPYFVLVEGLSYLNRSRVTLGRRYYSEVIRNYKPHLVLSVHDCLNRGYFQEARAILGKENVRCATYCSEYAGGYGYSRNWVEPSVDLYISRTRTAKNYAVTRYKLDPEKIIVRGHFLVPRIYEEKLSAFERHRFITERLGLRSDRKIIFLATGGTGANNHLSLLPAIKQYSETFQVLVVCGRNNEAFMKVRNWKRNNPDLRCHVEGYCNEMHLFMQVSDLVITRGGTTTCSEALHYECPIIFNGLGGVMPQEKLTAKYFLQDESAEIISKPADLERLLMEWNRFPERFRDLKRRFRNMRFKDRPSEVIYDLVDLAHDALPERERPALKVVGE